MPARKQSSARYDDDGDSDVEDWDDCIEEPGPAGADPNALRLRDWRDVERYREMKELRELVDDEGALDGIFAEPEPDPEPEASRAAAVRQKSRASARTRVATRTPVRRQAKKRGTSRRRGR